MKFSQPCAPRTGLREVIADKRKARSQLTHESIQRAAEQIVLTEGHTQLTTKRLVQEAGVSERTIFNHFSNLNEIVLSQLSAHLAEVIDAEAFPEDIPLEELPQACHDFLKTTLENEKSAEPLDRFLLLAGTFSGETNFDEILGKEVMETLISMDWSVWDSIETKYPHMNDDQQFQLAIYLQNMITSFAYGMGRYLYQHPELMEDPSKYSNREIRQNMIWSIDQVTQGQPKFTSPA